MTVHFALFLSPDGIALAHRQQAGHWAFLGDVGFDAPDLDTAMANLRAKGEAREGKGFATLLVLPDDQILYTSLTAPTDDPDLTEYRIEEGLEGLTPYTVAELVYDWREIEEDRVKLAVVARETLDEARAFAEGHGFHGVGFAAMPPLEKFPGVPLFDLSGPAHGLSFPDEGLAFGADAWSETVTPAEPAATEGVTQPEMDAADEAPEATDDAPDTVEGSADPAPPSEPTQAAEETAQSAPTPEAAGPEQAQDSPAPTGPEDTPAAPADPAEPEAETPADEDTPQQISDPMLDGPVAPLPDTEADTPSAPSQPEAPAAASEPATGTPAGAKPPVAFVDDLDGSGDDDLPPVPSAAVLKARRRGASGAAATDDYTAKSPDPGTDAADATAEAAPATPTFSARRARDATAAIDPKAPRSEVSGDLVGQRKSRIGFAAGTPSSETAATDAEDKPGQKRVARGELSGRLARLRDISRAPAAGDPGKSRGDSAPKSAPPKAQAKPVRSPKPDAEPRGQVRRASPKSATPRAAATGKPDLTAPPAAKGRLSGMLTSARDTIASRPSADRGDTDKPRRLSGLLDSAKQGSRSRTKSDAATPAGDDSPRRASILPGRRKRDTAPAPEGSEGRLSALGAALATDQGPGTAGTGSDTSDRKVARTALDPAPASAPRDDADGAFSSGLLARKSEDGAAGPSFRTGLILTVVLLVLLALIALWSALFLPNSPVARLLSGGTEQSAAVSDDPLTAPPPPAAITAPPAIGRVDPSTAPAVTAPEVTPETTPETTPVQRPETAAAPQPDVTDEAEADGIDLAALPATQSPTAATPAETAAAAPTPEAALPDIDADLDLPPLPPTPEDLLPSVEEAERFYAEDGIWPRTPARPDPGQIAGLNDLYVASIDPEISDFDAVALPAPGVNPGEMLRRMPSPPPFGTELETDARGLVRPTPEGVVTPDGAFVISGQPAIVAQPRPRELAPQVEPPDTAVEEAILGTFTPPPRPTDLDETRERQVLGGLTLNELSDLRPPERPLSAQEAAAQASLFPGTDAGDADAAAGPATAEAEETTEVAAETEADVIGGSALAVAQSRVPPTRPANIAELVANAERAQAAQPTAVAPSQIAPQPQIPSNADVARAATERNALRLRDLNLIGVTGTNANRRALVRLPSGRFVRVAVGDRLNGGTVAAIGESTLQYVRNGRTITLEVPG
ncbi:Translation initiation factor 2 (IF-2, GTPase) [Roseibacterium elongatum DSM 19469]|uniref:Translation initiation factor 2 (IF-2, GTPase) n=1 Tax=Roseicyclus elongatus DSM 19469 TaxID=1294273 RepID=W8S9H9_9RHOB|nr:hypothetical protein [Roseibacterium elongatum]AHM05661.1 Translation initiation factor 2 (IF-2, GTPase) [Roseibacterium elongatum DSM 19469]